MLLPGQSAAQLTVDQVPNGRTITTAERVEQEIQSARLRLGPLRVIPMVVVDNAGYDNNVFGRPEGNPALPIVGDYTVTAGAGGRGILPMGSKFYLRLVAVPQYIWYDKLADRRTWAGDYSATFLALGNRLSAEAGGSLSRSTEVLNSETQATVIQTNKGAKGKVEVDLTRALSLVAGAELEQVRFSGQDPASTLQVEQFNRTDSAALAGLRLRLTPELDLTGGVQGTRSEFVQNSGLRDNESYAVLGGLHFDRPKFFVNVAGGYRKGRSFNGSLFPRYSTSVGSYFLSWNVVGPLELQGFGHRRPVYSRFAADQIYIETLNGGGLELRLGSRVRLRGSAQTGTNSYPHSVLNDAITSYGGGVSLRVFGSTVITADAHEVLQTPGGVGAQRKIFRIVTGLSFNEELTR